MSSTADDAHEAASVVADAAVKAATVVAKDAKDAAAVAFNQATEQRQELSEKIQELADNTSAVTDALAITLRTARLVGAIVVMLFVVIALIGMTAVALLWVTSRQNIAAASDRDRIIALQLQVADCVTNPIGPCALAQQADQEDRRKVNAATAFCARQPGNDTLAELQSCITALTRTPTGKPTPGP